MRYHPIYIYLIKITIIKPANPRFAAHEQVQKWLFVGSHHTPTLWKTSFFLLLSIKAFNYLTVSYITILFNFCQYNLLLPSLILYYYH